MASYAYTNRDFRERAERMCRRLVDVKCLIDGLNQTEAFAATATNIRFGARAIAKLYHREMRKVEVGFFHLIAVEYDRDIKRLVEELADERRLALDPGDDADLASIDQMEAELETLVSLRRRLEARRLGRRGIRRVGDAG
ncbi:MAG: hypothetical protein P4L82_12035 [Ancalomicrobiaceae bacterium]|nr:hypothetical protein [Ancalomicrobiaceae bacterium]